MEKMKFSFQRDITYGLSWAQRNYTCSFCKKEYKSAQALGGHMNVHRRDRAKLMSQLSSPTYDLHKNPNNDISFPSTNGTNSSSNLNLNPVPTFSSPSTKNHNTSIDSNPNPNFSSSSSNNYIRYFLYGTPIIPSFGNPNEEGKLCLKKKREDEFRVLKKKKNVLNTDTSVGFIGENKQDLDLELRLGCS